MNYKRRNFLKNSLLASVAGAVIPDLIADQTLEERFQIGIQEYTFNRWLKSGKLDHLDYPKLAKEKLGITNIEYWSRAFKDKHTDKTYVGELAKRSTGEGMKNLLILVDIKKQLDAKTAKERNLSIEEHKTWIDCAQQLGCKAIRVNCRSGGDPEENLKHMEDGLGRLCDYAKDTQVKVVIEPHGGNSQDPAWLLKAMQLLNRDNAGLLPDFNNFGKYDRYDAVAKTLPHAVAVCAKALGFDEKGNEKFTDYYKMLKIVRDSKFSGVISVEFEGHGVDPVEGSLKTKELILKALKQA